MSRETPLSTAEVAARYQAKLAEERERARIRRATAPAKRRAIKPAGIPCEPCYTCPRFKECPLVRYVAPCRFREIYVRQQEMAG